MSTATDAASGHREVPGRARCRPVDGGDQDGRRAHPHVPAAYTLEAFRDWIDRGRRNLRIDTVDLVQLHCPQTPVFADDRVYDALDTLVGEGRIGAHGMSVETVDQALTAIARAGVARVQIILNVFRRKPLEHVLPAARHHGVGIIARVALAADCFPKIQRGHQVRARPSSQLQPARGGVRCRRDLQRRSPDRGV
jgi:aryl-alcohol dehydrogenase-like predicted oxidoreductase